MKTGNTYLITLLFVLFESCSSVKVLDPAGNFNFQGEFQNELKRITKLNCVSENSSTDFYIVFGTSIVQELPIKFRIEENYYFIDSIGNSNWERDMAYLMNRIPDRSDYWSTSSDLLWDNYRECLKKIDIDRLRKDQSNYSGRRENLRKYLLGNSALYNKYREVYFNSLQYIQSSLLAKDSMQLEIGKHLSSKAYDDWILFGNKTTYEDSTTSLKMIDFKSELKSLSEALNDIDPFLVYYVSDPYFMNYYSTGYQPEFEQMKWQQAIVPINNLPTPGRDAQNEYSITNSFLKFQYCIISIERPWFHPEIFEYQVNQSVSNAHHKELRYVKSFVLTTNIELEYQIKTKKDFQLTSSNGERRDIKHGEPNLVKIKYSNKMGISAYICKL